MKKIQTKKNVKKKTPAKPEVKQNRFFEAVGRRKTATARVRIYPGGNGEILINDKSLDMYFPMLELQQIVKAALEKTDFFGKFRVLVRVKGGGFHSQAEAVRHSITRALVLYDVNLRKDLKKAGWLTRDPRMRERKKFGLKRARRAPQWRKR